MRKTRNGDVLLEIGANSKNNQEFGSRLKEIMKEEATVKCLEPKETIEIRDLDDITTTDEIEEAILRETKLDTLEMKLSLIETNSRGLKLAIVEMSARLANKVLELPNIKIGWVRCRIRKRLKVKRCYRCFGYGHHQSECEGPNRKGEQWCIQCEEKGHIKKGCQSAPSCFLSTEKHLKSTSHLPGSGKCQIFRKALEKARTKM